MNIHFPRRNEMGVETFNLIDMNTISEIYTNTYYRGNVMSWEITVVDTTNEQQYASVKIKFKKNQRRTCEIQIRKRIRVR